MLRFLQYWGILMPRGTAHLRMHLARGRLVAIQAAQTRAREWRVTQRRCRASRISAVMQLRFASPHARVALVRKGAPCALVS